MTRKSLRIFIPAALAVVAAPLLFLGDSGWHSPCACMAQNELFARMSDTDQRRLFHPEQGPASVMKGLSTKVRGRTMDDVAAHPALSHMVCVPPNKSMVVCQIWLEKKGDQQRGYEVGFVLSPDDKIHGVSQATIIHRGGA